MVVTPAQAGVAIHFSYQLFDKVRSAVMMVARDLGANYGTDSAQGRTCPFAPAYGL